MLADVGVMWFRVTVMGKSANAAKVWLGVNAIDKAMKIYDALQEF